MIFGAWRSPVSASVLGAEGRRFESSRPDTILREYKYSKYVVMSFDPNYNNENNLLVNLESLTGEEQNFLANTANAASLIFESYQSINWAGFYFAYGGELILGPFQGKPACIKIPFGRGVCGACAEQRQTVIVPDVHEFPGHIACDADSRSEIVVPLIYKDQLIGVLDIDSPVVDRFYERDKIILEQVVDILLKNSDADRFISYLNQK